MSVYSLDHVIQECINDRFTVNTTARGKSPAAKVEIYSSSWLTLNQWIESRLSKHKGASIGGFGSFCWEMLEKDGETHCRPLFLPSDSFLKLYKVKRQRIHRVPQLTPVEEVNYSLLAIKYSKSLTKDMVYAGIHDLLKKIGDFIARGYEMEIDFTFGTLCVKENKLKFIFSQSRLLEILPENLEPDVLARDTRPMKYVEPHDSDMPHSSRPGTSRGQTPTTSISRSSSSLRRPSTSGGALQLPKLSARGNDRTVAKSMDATNGSLFNKQTKPEIPPLTLGNTNNTAITSHNAGIAAMGETFDSTSSSQQSHNNQLEDTMKSTKSSLPPPPVDLEEVLEAMGHRHLKVQKEAFREQARARVEAQAYSRCLQDLENNAHKDDARRFEERRDFEQWKAKLQEERAKSVQKLTAMKSTLTQQVDEAMKRREKEILEQKTSVASFILGEKAGTVPSAFGSIVNPDGTVIPGRQRISKELEEQIKQNAERKLRIERETKLRERDHMERLALETEMQQVMERAAHLEKQRMLLQAWERDGHIRNLQKLQDFGKGTVKDYIERNLSTPPGSAPFHTGTLSGAGTLNGMTLGQALTSSIGYDPRGSKMN